MTYCIQHTELCSMLCTNVWYIQPMYGNLDRRGFGEEWIHVYMFEGVPSLFTWNYHNIVCLSAIPQYKIKCFWFKKKEKNKNNNQRVS